MHPEFPKLLIECPIDLQQRFPLRTCDWETFGGVLCLKLPIQPSEYTPVLSYPNEEPKYIRTLGAIQFQQRAYEYAIDLKVTDERFDLYSIFQLICARSNLPNRTKQDLRVWDWVVPEAEDSGMTLRTGAFSAPQAQGGRVVLGERSWIKGGFTIKFMEKRMRLR